MSTDNSNKKYSLPHDAQGFLTGGEPVDLTDIKKLLAGIHRELKKSRKSGGIAGVSPLTTPLKAQAGESFSAIQTPLKTTGDNSTALSANTLTIETALIKNLHITSEPANPVNKDIPVINQDSEVEKSNTGENKRIEKLTEKPTEKPISVIVVGNKPKALESPEVIQTKPRDFSYSEPEPIKKKGFFSGLFKPKKEPERNIYKELSEINLDGDEQIEHLKTIANYQTGMQKFLNGIKALTSFAILLPITIGKSIGNSIKDKYKAKREEAEFKSTLGIFKNTLKMINHLAAIRTKLKANVIASGGRADESEADFGRLDPSFFEKVIGGLVTVGVVGAILLTLIPPETKDKAIEEAKNWFLEKTGIATIISKWQQAVDNLSETFTNIDNWWTGIKDWFKKNNNWETVFKYIKDSWNDISDSLLNIFNDIGKSLFEKLGLNWDATKYAVKKTVSTVVDASKATVNTVSDAAQDANNAVKEKTGVDVIDGARNAAQRAYDVSASTAGSLLENIMPKGYRHKALFDGIKGGDALTKNGSYTDAEAATIRHLKTSGANTTANLAGGMPLEIQDKISAQAKRYGLDPVMMQKVAAMESGGNANAISSTGAAGIFQFTGQTASGMGIINRFDANQNIEGGVKLAKRNSAILAKKGLPVTPENIYMMHQLGEGAAPEVIRGAMTGKLKSDLSASTQNAMNLNFGKDSNTAADYIATNKAALDKRYALVTKNNIGIITQNKVDANTLMGNAGNDTIINNNQPLQANSTSPFIPIKAQAPINSYVPAPVPPKMPTPPRIDSAIETVKEKPINLSMNDNKNPISIIDRSIGQNVSDTAIAHIIGGGVGMANRDFS